MINMLIKWFIRNSGLPSAIASKLKPFNCKREPLFKQIETIEELEEKAFPMLTTIGPYLFKDPLLIAKMIRICKTLLASSDTSDIKYAIATVLDEAILPAVSLVESNCSLSEELWILMKAFPYQQRYKLYTNWKSEPTNTLMIRTRASTLKRIKYIMKRLSKENVKLSGRQIGKLSHSNPSYLFEYVSLTSFHVFIL